MTEPKHRLLAPGLKLYETGAVVMYGVLLIRLAHVSDRALEQAALDAIILQVHR